MGNPFTVSVGNVLTPGVGKVLDIYKRTVRQSMARRGIDRLPILPEGRQSPTPTTARILETFSDVAWYEFERPTDQVVFPVRLTPLQKDLLKLLEMDASAYR